MRRLAIQPAAWTRAFRFGAAAQIALVGAISLLAYSGLLHGHLPKVPHFDHLMHALLMGAAAFWLDGAWSYRPLSMRLPGWIRRAPVVVTLVVAVEEIAQVLSPHRSSSLQDFGADCVGIVLGSWFSQALFRKLVVQPSK